MSARSFARSVSRIRWAAIGVALIGVGVGACSSNLDVIEIEQTSSSGSNRGGADPSVDGSPAASGGSSSGGSGSSSGNGGSSQNEGEPPQLSHGDFCVTAPWTDDPQPFVNADGATNLPPGTYTLRYVGGAQIHDATEGYEVSAHYAIDGIEAGHHVYNGASPETSSTSIWLDAVGIGSQPSVAATEQANAGLSWTITTTGGPLFITYLDNDYSDNQGPGSELCVDVPISSHDNTAACPTTCGPNGNDDCCASPVVTGGTFSRSYDGVTYDDPSYVATVSTFRLDKYDVTVGRFRAFLAAYPGSIPIAGAGKNPNDPSDPGWQSSWDVLMPQSSADLAALLPVDTQGQRATWTDAPGANENDPIGGVTWYEANAFCAWDGGRLPTEAEWNYAAAGGSEQRVYPWSSPPTSTTVDPAYADYNQNEVDGPGAIDPVGSQSPKGDGKWGQSDLVGDAWQWTYDNFASPYAQQTCDDCANETEAFPRVWRGGSAFHGTGALPVSLRHDNSADTPTTRWADVTVRCARGA